MFVWMRESNSEIKITICKVINFAEFMRLFTVHYLHPLVVSLMFVGIIFCRFLNKRMPLICNIVNFLLSFFCVNRNIAMLIAWCHGVSQLQKERTLSTDRQWLNKPLLIYRIEHYTSVPLIDWRKQHNYELNWRYKNVFLGVIWV